MQEIIGACPSEYDSSAKYDGKDLVSVGTLINPVKHFVYQCKAWPYGAYCSSGKYFAPGADNGELGWTLKGWCDATVTTTTTTSTPWTGSCEWLNGTTPVTISPWSAGALSTYSAGTRSPGYEPEQSQYWGDAWTKAGTCASPVATSSTTVSGNLTLTVNTTTARRRELLTVGSLSNSQIVNLIDAVKETIETVVCTNLQINQVCTVNILTINGQPITRRLRRDAQRVLAEESIVILYEIIMKFACSTADCSDDQDIIYDIYAKVTGEMITATADSSLVTLMVASPSFDTLESLLSVSSIKNTIITEQPTTF
ncbi:hypothetical protein ACHAW6_002595 [Cyclotella cf. meneghiniana]